MSDIQILVLGSIAFVNPIIGTDLFWMNGSGIVRMTNGCNFWHLHRIGWQEKHIIDEDLAVTVTEGVLREAETFPG